MAKQPHERPGQESFNLPSIEQPAAKPLTPEQVNAHFEMRGYFFEAYSSETMAERYLSDVTKTETVRTALAKQKQAEAKVEINNAKRKFAIWKDYHLLESVDDKEVTFWIEGDDQEGTKTNAFNDDFAEAYKQFQLVVASCGEYLPKGWLKEKKPSFDVKVELDPRRLIEASNSTLLSPEALTAAEYWTTTLLLCSAVNARKGNPEQPSSKDEERRATDYDYPKNYKELVERVRSELRYRFQEDIKEQPENLDEPVQKAQIIDMTSRLPTVQLEHALDYAIAQSADRLPVLRQYNLLPAAIADYGNELFRIAVLKEQGEIDQQPERRANYLKLRKIINLNRKNIALGILSLEGDL